MTPQLLDTYKDLQSILNSFPEKTKMYFLRHGQTNNNLNGIVQGADATDTSLNLTGIDQSHTIGKKLKDVSFDLTFTSPAVRTKQTFEIVRNYVGTKLLNQYELESLQEISWGSNIDLKPMGTAYENLNNKMFKERKYNFTDGGSETLNDVLRRCVDALTEISEIMYSKLGEKKINDEPNILITGHGFYLGLLLTVIIDKKLQLAQKPENGSCKILTFSGRASHTLTQI